MYAPFTPKPKYSNYFKCSSCSGTAAVAGEVVEYSGLGLVLQQNAGGMGSGKKLDCWHKYLCVIMQPQ